jgi:hypothetical protein
LKCIRAPRTGGAVGERIGGQGAMDAISIPFYSDTRGVIRSIPIRGGGRFYDGERRLDTSCTSDVRVLGASFDIYDNIPTDRTTLVFLACFLQLCSARPTEMIT